MTSPARRRASTVGPARSSVRLLVWAVVAAGCWASLVAPAAAQIAPTAPTSERAGAPDGKVLVLSLPRLRWADVAKGQMPALDRFLERSAVANLSVRTIGPRASLGEGYVTMGSGNRATVDDLHAGVAVQRGERGEEGDEVEAFTRRMGGPPTGDVFTTAFPLIRSANDALLYGAEPGALGAALRDAGLRTAVVANADVTDVAGREAVLGLMDDAGTVAVGRVDDGLTVADPTAPYGIRSDADEVDRAVAEAWAGADVVLVEAGDLERADRYAALALPVAAERLAAEARASADRLVAAALDLVDPARDTVLVVAPASPARRPESLTVFAMSGPDVDQGLASSGSTRRPGYVTLTDIAPTILDRLGVDRPDAMTGTVIASEPDDRPPAVLDREFTRVNELAIFRDKATGPVTVAFIVFQIACYLAGLAAVTFRRRGWRPLVGFAALMVLAFPTLAFLSGLVDYDGLGIAGYIAAMFVLSALAAAVARALGAIVARRAPRIGDVLPPLLLVAGTWLTMVADVVALDGRLQIDTVFGYSPIVAGRFAGFGNQAFSLLTMAAVVLASGVWSLRRLGAGRGDRPDTGPRRRADWLGLALIAAFFAVTVVVDGHPGLGSDVGGVLAMVPAAAVLGLLLADVRIDLRRGAAIVGGTALVLAVFAVADLARPAASRTHLGRLVSDTVGGGAGDLATVVQRKIAANLSILFSSVWTLMIPFAVALIVYIGWRRVDLVHAVEERAPGLRAGLWAAAVLSLLGFALNDSGVAVPAMMLAVLLPYLTYLVMGVDPAPPPGATRPSPVEP